ASLSMSCPRAPVFLAPARSELGAPGAGRRPTARTPLPRNESSTRQTLVFDDNAAAAALYGEGDRTLRTLEREFGIHAGARGNEVRLVGPTTEVALGRKVLGQLYRLMRRAPTPR